MRCALLAVLWVAAAAACSTRGAAPEADAGAYAGRADVLLLGEVHDNAQGHRERLALLRARVEAGWRPVIAMEQFDRERQADLDRALTDCADAACVVRAAGGEKAAWDWSLYEPVIALALQHDLPVLAANLSRADAGKVMQAGFGAALDAATVHEYGLDTPLPEDLLATQVEEVRAGHCGQLPEAMLEPMARAQVARDVWMARTLAAHAGNGRGLVLLAGNGHVRRDVGVPWWLARRGVAGVRSVGYVEAGRGDESGARPEEARFDETHAVQPQDRPDPCAAFG